MVTQHSEALLTIHLLWPYSVRYQHLKYENLDMPIRLLFLNTRDQCGADVSVHLMLMANFAADEVEVFVISNSEAADAEEMRARLAGMPHVTSRFLPLGKPAETLSRRGKLGKALAYVPSGLSLLKAAAFVRR